MSTLISSLQSDKSNSGVKVRPFEVPDIAAVMAVVAQCQPYLEVHSEFNYWMVAALHGRLSGVLEREGEIVGFASAENADTPPATTYLWQLAVHPQERGQRHASKLIDYVARAARARGCTSLMFSIAPDNQASLRAFEAYARSIGSSVEWCGHSGTHLVPEDVFRINIRHLRGESP